MSQHQSTVLVTGAGGAAAVTLIRALTPMYRVIAGDIDPYAVGLYLVPPEDRVLLRRGDDPDFVPALLQEARTHGADLVIPTVDVELADVSAAADTFAAHGIRLLVETVATLECCLDKWQLMQRCASVVRVPTTMLLECDTTDHAMSTLGRPFIVKPRAGAGGRGFAVIDGPEALGETPRDGSYIMQEYLPGEEFSIDVLGRPDGHIVSAVPRRRDKVDSGIAVAGRTVHDPSLIAFGRSVAEAIGVVGVVNVQARRAVDGTPALLEVNPRFPGTMALTMAAGVDMPTLAVAAAYGERIPDSIDFTEVAVVRHWADVVVPIEEYTTIQAPVAAG
ncbi:carbamoyl-phosphate synthase large subunit [Antricoccus suffuscus]|uniref:Carbamoyl-phosphate synthase large subunit n=1 Tax=Antricoccus suffuscus TaxID=1629062 RepID=A0A2T1A650_9ACTN|nr:ATP-grasp domain-containing protein [Antricoccus suffuscus]PRZ44034.1 carbamoyl-phosphate synthase large subunit [Antricoccus suffuscus]